MEEALKMSVMWYGVAYLPILRAMPEDKLKELVREIDGISGELPLHCKLHSKEAERLKFKNWKEGAQISGPQTIALMVFSLWVILGENEDLCSSLCESWYVKEAVFLAPKKEEIKTELSVTTIEGDIENDKISTEEQTQIIE